MIIIVLSVFLLLFPDASKADPRAQVVKISCGNQLEHNGTVFVPNFISNMVNISTQMQTTSFGFAVTGSGPDTNYGLAQCYGDLSLLDCVLCYAESRVFLPQCYPYNGGKAFLDGCFMRFENYSFFHEYIGTDDLAICGSITRRGSNFQRLARQAISQVVSSAPINNGYARAEMVASNESIYVLGECWRTLNANDCRTCLENASESMSGCFPWSDGRVLNTGCFLRYSDTNFLNPIPRSGSSRETTIIIVVAALSAMAVLIIGGVVGTHLWRNRIIQKKRKGDAPKLVSTLNDSSLNFKYSTIEKAANSFDEANKLGQGGFGTVYKGVLPDGREIAIKRLFFNNKYRAGDFFNEVNIISSVEHKNIVRLLGCSCSGPESLLVYEYMPNRSLDRFIFDSSKGKLLKWERRFEIIVGTVEGLVYLHENSKECIIHRDIKASNILLDSRLRAKIADFGLARSFQEDKSHISTAIAGTLGYMAPEYLAHGQLTEKADVYSFGVLLLEIVTGRQNNRSKTVDYTESLVAIAWNNFQTRTSEDLIDPNLMIYNYAHSAKLKQEILRVVHVGLLCTQEIPSLRPSMSKTLQMLVKNDEPLPDPTSPPFMDENKMEFNGTTENPSAPRLLENGDSIACISESIFFPR